MISRFSAAFMFDAHADDDVEALNRKIRALAQLNIGTPAERAMITARLREAIGRKQIADRVHRRYSI